MQCLEFQRGIDKGENEVVNLLSEKEFLENEIHLLDEKNNALKNLMLAFMDEIVQDLLDCNSGTFSTCLLCLLLLLVEIIVSLKSCFCCA
jgi:hypothetical protein